MRQATLQGPTYMWTLAAVSRLATCACLAGSVFPGLFIHLPRLAPRVTLAVRADARDVIYLSICDGSMRMTGDNCLVVCRALVSSPLVLKITGFLSTDS